jgi:hypothetical protein
MTSAGSLRSPLEGALVVRLLERLPSSARLPVGVLTREEKAAELRRLQARKAMDAATRPSWCWAWPRTRRPGMRPPAPDPLEADSPRPQDDYPPPF